MALLPILTAFLICYIGIFAKMENSRQEIYVERERRVV